MKTKVIVAIFASIAFASFKAPAFPVSSPPGNIATNGLNGEIGIVNNPNAPNGFLFLGGDMYEYLSTIPGQQYSLDFYAAADLYFGPTLTLDVSLNSQTLMTFYTPPYTYNPGINRYDQMQWEEFDTSFTASSSATELEFIDENTYDFGLNAVSVLTVPEPGTMTLILLGGVAMMSGLLWRRRLRAAPGFRTGRDWPAQKLWPTQVCVSS